MSRYIKSIDSWKLFLAVRKYAQAHKKESPELLFARFARKMRIHKAFEAYLDTIPPMKRDQRQLHQRKLFIQWFYHRYSGKKRKLTTASEAADLIFASERTVEKDLMDFDKEKEILF